MSEQLARRILPDAPDPHDPGRGRDARTEPIAEPHLLDYLQVLARHKYPAALALVCSLAAAAAYLAITTPVYEATARVLIEPGTPNVVEFKQVLDERGSERDFYQTQYELLKSRAIARRAIERLGLWDHPMLTRAGADDTSVPSRARRLWERLRGTIQPVPSGAGLAGLSATGTAGNADSAARSVTATATTAAAIDRFLAGVRTSPVSTSRLVDVIVRSPDPRFAARAVNGLARAYISDNLDLRFTATREASAWLDEQLRDQRREVEKAEAALQTYRERHDALTAEDRQSIVVQKLEDLNGALTRAKTDRLQKETQYRQVAALDGKAAVEAFVQVRTDPTVQKLRTDLTDLERERAQLADRFGPRHPEIVKRDAAVRTVQGNIDRAVATIVESMRTEYEAAVAQERSLTQALDEQKGQAQQMNRAAIDYAVLDRDVQSSKEIYNSLLQRAKEMTVAGQLRTSNVRLVDEAEVPTSPVAPRSTPVLLMALLGGGFLALTVVYLREYLDRRLRTPQDVESHLKQASLGMIPRLPRRSRSQSSLMDAAVPTAFAEAFRGLRTNVMLSSNPSLGSVVVTSTFIGEGKTTIASNLAIGLAQAGHRAVLLDADMRRPRVHELFGLEREHGLSDILQGYADASDSLKATAVPNLTVISAGSRIPNPAELIGGAGFARLLATVEAGCDVLVIDTPPVMPVSDASLVSHHASTVLFVVSAETTHREAAQLALAQLVRARSRCLGVILNRADVRRNHYYYEQYSPDSTEPVVHAAVR